MSLIVYLDETGDHTLEKVDKDFPVFAVTLFVCERDYYCQTIIPELCRLKMKWFGHEAIILHSRDIRKNEKEFSFLADLPKKQRFYDDINQCMTSLDYKIISVVIRKQEHKDKYVKAAHPYDLALKFALERLLPHLEEIQQKQVQIVAESRGEKEDKDLRLSFLQIINSGTEYISKQRFDAVGFKLWFATKGMNVIGTQLSDLAGYPIARHVLNPSKTNLAYEIIKSKIYKGNGLKIFP